MSRVEKKTEPKQPDFVETVVESHAPADPAKYTGQAAPAAPLARRRDLPEMVHN